MAYSHKENNGSLFKNENKEKDSQPDYNGTINISGKLYRISAWVNEAQTGKKYFGLKVSPMPEIEEVKKQVDYKKDEIPF